MHQGQIIACDTPQNLKAQVVGELLEIRANPPRKAMAVLRQASPLNVPQLFGDIIHILVDEAEKRSLEMKYLLEQKDVKVEEIRRIAPGLEDVFVTRLAGIDKEPAPLSSARLADTLISEGDRSDITIKVADLTKRFGDFTAVDGVNFEIRRGEIFGLLGPNGSGKTTTIRMITGLLTPTSGSAFVLGRDMTKEADKARASMGYMSQRFSLFPSLTVEENIKFYAGLYGMPSSLLEKRQKWVLDMAGLRGKEKAMTQELSGGWRQRLALGCTIIHSPEVIFLDEPTSGVDPLSRRFFWELIHELADKGTTIFITTHYMDEAEHCHRLGLIYQGKLIALGSPLQLKADLVKGELLEIVTSDFARALELLSADLRYHQMSLFGSAIHVVVDKATAASPEIERLLEASNVAVHSISRIPFTMEDVFISLVEEQEVALTSQRGEKGA
jgi:ABC-2 type transport system ATP-binding protein